MPVHMAVSALRTVHAGLRETLQCTLDKQCSARVQSSCFALQGCLAAFFAKEEVTWACPAEVKAASTARSGINQGQELSSCSPSVDVSTPDAREKFKRRRYSIRTCKQLFNKHIEAQDIW